MSNLTVEDYHDEIRHAAQTAAPLFKLYGWTYFDNDTPPNLNRLEQTITELVSHTVHHFNEQLERGEEFPEASVGTGRFFVTLKQYEDERDLRISLELASKGQYKDWTF